MSIFIKLSPNERRIFFNNLKDSIAQSWDCFYPKYNISRTMFFNYLSGRYCIPKNLFKEWRKLAGVNIKNFQEINKSKYIFKKIPSIKIDDKLAEIFGVLNGDGHLSKHQNEINVVGDSREKDYLKYLKNLLEEKFSLKFTFFEEPTRVKLRVYSKDLSDYLVFQHGFKKGKKKGNLQVPEAIKNSTNLKISYIRGLFDTDGTIYLRRKSGLVIEISNVDKLFREEIKSILDDIGIVSCINKRYVSIYRQDQIHKFFKMVKPSNPKHLNNYKKYSNYARMV